MKKIAIIYLGHSHLAAMTPYLYDRPLETGPNNLIKHYVFDTSAHNIFAMDETRFPYSIMLNGRHEINPEISKMIDRIVPADYERHYVSMFGGNSHNALMLLQPDRKFDVIIPEEETIHIEEGAELVPYNALRATISNNAISFLNDIRALKNTFVKNTYHIQSPPPIFDDKYVNSVVNNDPFFSKLPRSGITPAWGRYKAWSIHTSIFKELCDEIGVSFVKAPEKGVVSGHWLSSDCTGNDPTHGNYEYGGHILREMEARLGGHFGGWGLLK